MKLLTEMLGVEGGWGGGGGGGEVDYSRSMQPLHNACHFLVCLCCVMERSERNGGVS